MGKDGKLMGYLPNNKVAESTNVVVRRLNQRAREPREGAGPIAVRAWLPTLLAAG